MSPTTKIEIDDVSVLRRATDYAYRTGSVASFNNVMAGLLCHSGVVKLFAEQVQDITVIFIDPHGSTPIRGNISYHAASNKWSLNT